MATVQTFSSRQKRRKKRRAISILFYRRITKLHFLNGYETVQTFYFVPVLRISLFLSILAHESITLVSIFTCSTNERRHCRRPPRHRPGVIDFLFLQTLTVSQSV